MQTLNLYNAKSLMTSATQPDIISDVSNTFEELDAK